MAAYLQTIINGTSQDKTMGLTMKFEPNRGLTKAESAKIMWRFIKGERAINQ
jgi:hypothetical protein